MQNDLLKQFYFKPLWKKKGFLRKKTKGIQINVGIYSNHEKESWKNSNYSFIIFIKLKNTFAIYLEKENNCRYG